MAEFLTVEELAGLPGHTVLISRLGTAAQALAGPEADYRWALPGRSGDLLSAQEMVDGSDGWRVLRYGPTDGDGPAVDVGGTRTFSTDGSLITVRHPGDPTSRPVAMCSSAQWAQSVAETLNAADVAAYPAVVAAAQRVLDLQREIERQRQRQGWERLDETTRERVAVVAAARLGGDLQREFARQQRSAFGTEIRSAVGEILDVLGMLPVDGFADDLPGALAAIRTRVEELNGTVGAVRAHVAGRVVAVLRGRRVGGASIPDLVDMLVGEIRALRAQRDRPVPERAGAGGTATAAVLNESERLWSSGVTGFGTNCAGGTVQA